MKNRRLIFAFILFDIITFGVAYLCFWPTPIDPEAWTPPVAPALEGQYAPNDALSKVKRLGQGAFIGAEDVAVDSQGRIYAGSIDGKVFRFPAGGAGQPEFFANTGGRPLGLKCDKNDNLIVADCKKGLLSVAQNGTITTLSTEANGVKFKFTDDLDIGPDGTIYFTDASSKFDQPVYRLDFMEHRPNGRLLAYDPMEKSTRVLIDKSYFANGVTVAPDGQSLLLCETSKYRVLRYWIAGEKKGKTETFIENLPGFPDGISTGSNGIYWISLFSRRNAILDSMLPRPFWRSFALRLPQIFQPKAKHYGFVVGVNNEGKVVKNLQDSSPQSFAPVTNTIEYKGTLYFGSLEADGIASLPVPQ